MFPSTFHPNNAARAHWLVQIPWKCNLGYIPAGWSVATVDPAFLLDAAHWTFSPPPLFPCCSHRIPVLVPALVSYLVLRTEWKLSGKAKSKTLPSTFLDCSCRNKTHSYRKKFNIENLRLLTTSKAGFHHDSPYLLYSYLRLSKGSTCPN